MHSPLFNHLTVATGAGGTLADVNGAAGYVVWVFLSGLIALVAVIRVLRQPADNWKHGNWSKVAWVAATLYLAPIVGGYPVPMGAIAAIWRTSRHSTTSDGPGQHPRAEGSPDWPWPWAAK